MSKRHSKNRDRIKSNTRDAFRVASPSGLSLRPVVRHDFSLSSISDRREWSPDKSLSYTLEGRPARVIVSSKPNFNYSRVKSDLLTGFNMVEHPRFLEPFKVLTCVRRKIRKEVLFAMKKAGKGKRVSRPKWNDTSFVRC